MTGGASAAYGSDAVSGVVNFILDTKLNGFKTNIQGGITEIGDNENFTVSFAGGLPIGERMHLIGSIDYYSAEPIKDATARDWQQSQGLITNPLRTQPGQPQRITRSKRALHAVHRRRPHHSSRCWRADVSAVDAVPAGRPDGAVRARLGLHDLDPGRR